MVMLLRFPDEILVQILSYVPAKQLSDVFLLQSDSIANSYYRNLALYAKYFNTRTIMDGRRNGSLSFTELDRLVRNGVSIKPREISLVLTGTMNHQGGLQLWMQDLPLACVIASLDLSYNCINDTQIAQIQFPPSLRSLNLSNNELTYLSFKVDDNLECLNLSNNSLVRLTTSKNKIRHLNVSCNLLKREAISGLEAFTQLESLDLSRNMISNLFNVKFPKMKKLSLSGNHIDYITQNCIPESVQEIDLSYCRISEEHECFKRRKMKVIMQ